MLKFHAVAEKTAKNFRGLLFFAAPCSEWVSLHTAVFAMAAQYLVLTYLLTNLLSQVEEAPSSAE